MKGYSIWKSRWHISGKVEMKFLMIRNAFFSVVMLLISFLKFLDRSTTRSCMNANEKMLTFFIITYILIMLN